MDLAATAAVRPPPSPRREVCFSAQCFGGLSFEIATRLHLLVGLLPFFCAQTIRSFSCAVAVQPNRTQTHPTCSSVSWLHFCKHVVSAFLQLTCLCCFFYIFLSCDCVWEEGWLFCLFMSTWLTSVFSPSTHPSISWHPLSFLEGCWRLLWLSCLSTAGECLLYSG